jgi:membrane protein implicated in regulation of membrane protease activity
VLLVLAAVAAVLWVPAPWSWALIGVAAFVELGETAFWFRWSGRRRRARVGAETLIGRGAVVVLPCRPDGQVRIDGELWQARCAAGAAEGETVAIEALDGLTLVVRSSG